MYKKIIDKSKYCIDCGVVFYDLTFLQYRSLCVKCSSERKRIKKSFSLWLKEFDKKLDLTLNHPKNMTDSKNP
jgi:hypothetical protein